MNCRTARETLDVARLPEGSPHETSGDELQGPTINEAARHVNGCPACQTAVRLREQIDARIGQLCRDVPVPACLRERLLSRLEATSGPLIAPELAATEAPRRNDAGDRRNAE